VLPILEALIALQEKDRRLSRLARDLRDVPQRRAHLETLREDRRQTVAKSHDDVLKANAAIKQVEIEVEDYKTRIARFRQQQFEIKTNDEYRALEKEIREHEGKIREREDREIEFMERAEEARAVLTQCERDQKESERRIEEDLRALDVRARELEAESESVRAARAEAARGIEPAWLERYDRLLKHHGDTALASVENGACGGCHMKLTPQTSNDVRRGEWVVACGFCGRLLY